MFGRALLGLATIVLLATAACGGSGETSRLRTQVAGLQTQAAPDRVVGIEIRCERRSTDGNSVDFWGTYCTEVESLATAGTDASIGTLPSGATIINRRQMLT